ncbi:hypothetical protein SAMN05444390_11213 [Marinobacterium lutimaris]|uniref:Uncharacterized protein n=1 Tax=Marinobacterium lutimaris TaxID=568106 RepID=A0A1H6DXG6_9GAMM|nr:hypothetical protein SAMN05444390_11213 [Marinobacterium lutimaris]
MAGPLENIDPILVELLDEGISSIAALRLLVFVRHPRRFSEIEEFIGTERTVVNRMVSRCPGLLKKIQLPQDEWNRERGKPPVAIVATDRANRLLKNLLLCTPD